MKMGSEREKKIVSAGIKGGAAGRTFTLGGGSGELVLVRGSLT